MEPANPLSPEGGSRGGVLAHLERLEAKSRKKFEEPQGASRAESALGSKIRKLRSLRDKLRAEVNRRQARIEASVESDQTFEVSEQELLERKRQNVESILQAYHFTGLSGKLTSRGVCVSISTAFEGNLLDSYFVDIVIRKPLRIHHHSIPVFIPLEELSAKYLQTNIQHFLFRLCKYLNAYSGRKYQADRLQSDFAAFLAGPLQRNSLCNLLSFTYKAEPSGQSFPFCARLLYKDITATLPTDATVTHQVSVLSAYNLFSLETALEETANEAESQGQSGAEPNGHEKSVYIELPKDYSEWMYCPPHGKNSELPMKTCSVQSPFIKRLLHLQEEKKSWI